MKVIALFALYFLGLSICVSSCVVSTDPEMISTPKSLRQIPRMPIAKRLAAVKQDNEDEEDHVFEFDDGLLIGKNVTIDLSTKARPLSFTPEESSFQFIVNGQERPSQDVDAVVHKVGDYNVIYDEDNKISAVWGNDMLLEPVDPVKYPGIFINVQKKITFGDDEVEIANLKNPLKDLKTVHVIEEGSTRQSTQCRLLEVAVAYDNSLCARFGNSASRTAAYVRAVVGFASAVLRKGTCHQLRLVFIDANCRNPSDPYNYLPFLAPIPPSQRSRSILFNFRAFWLSNRRSVRRDVAYFFSGYTEGTGVAGAAFVGASCTTYGFGWVELGFRPVFTHEIGHSLGASHTTAGIMKAVFSGGPVFFSTVSKTQINAFLATPRASCIGRV